VLHEEILIHFCIQFISISLIYVNVLSFALLNCFLWHQQGAAILQAFVPHTFYSCNNKKGKQHIKTIIAYLRLLTFKSYYYIVWWKKAPIHSFASYHKHSGLRTTPLDKPLNKVYISLFVCHEFILHKSCGSTVPL